MNEFAQEYPGLATGFYILALLTLFYLCARLTRWIEGVGGEADPVDIPVVPSLEPERFTAACQCPKCGCVAIHFIAKAGKKSVTRQCTQCERMWKQIA